MAPLLYIYILLPPLMTGLIGFDYGGHGLNITILYSTSMIMNWWKSKLMPRKLTYNFYNSDYNKTRVQQCKVEVDLTIFYCDMHSYISVVQNGRRVYLHTVQNNVEQRLHETSILSLGESAIISGASSNSTTTSSINYNGWTLLWNAI